MTSPSVEHRSPRVPGEFESEDDISNPEGLDSSDLHDLSENQSSFLPDLHHSTDTVQRKDENQSARTANITALEERDMNNKLMDVESSFLPEFSHLAGKNGQSVGTDDTFLFGVPNNNLAVRRRPQPLGLSQSSSDLRASFGHENEDLRSPRTPPEMYKTPAPEQQNFKERDGEDEEAEKENFQQRVHTPSAPNTSSLETMSSSPTAARTVSRVQSMVTLGGYETADERGYPGSPYKRRTIEDEDDDATPRRHTRNKSSDGLFLGGRRGSEEQHNKISGESNSLSKRPRYLTSRSSQARLSYDSMASSNTDASDATLGADFALQSGGALPEPRLQRKSKMTLSRQGSLGSLISGNSGNSDDEARVGRSGSNAPDLSTLEEESPRSNTSQKRNKQGPMTPKASMNSLVMPTDTVIANNVRDFEVPGTFARQYRQERSMSPSKTLGMAGSTPGPKQGLTLKEHRSTVEKLGKENFDLKMKVHFLDQALQRRSEDGIKEIITENVQLKSDRIRLEKDNLQLRKQVRELQRKLADAGARESPSADQGYGTDEERSPTAEEELIYLRERVETNEVEIEKLRTENIAKESEKRRLAEMVRSLGDTRAGISDVGSREERDMWKDMLEAETIAREQSEEDNKRLRDEMSKLRQDTMGGRARSIKSRGAGSIVSRSSSIERTNTQNAEIERLRHEVSELQKMIGAQASTLTSRNKEKERLYQEIEDLKLGRMGGLRSIAGDSILDRSASRARSNSRASVGTRMSRISDAEREELEARINELRDSTSQLKLVNQDLQAQFDEVLAELDAVDAQAQADADQFNEELQLLTQERDNALREAEEQDQAFQQLKNEAQEEIDGLGDELDAKIEDCAKLEEALKLEAENVKALKGEMRSAAEGLVRLEEDAQNNLSRYQSVQAELDDANRELEAMEHNLKEAESKIQRFTVQQESSHNEIAFLREEQDGDKIKIGDLEALLKKVHLNLESERDRARELDRRLAEERRQRETVANKEKQEVQKMINDLNREASSAKDELRRAQKTLSSREIESNTHKQRLQELEDSLRHILGDADGNRTTLISSVTRIQRELDQTNVDLEATRRRLDERETLLVNRDQLLENQGLEYRKLTDALDRERQSRRQDKHSFEQSLKSHQQSTRALNANSSRIAELEQGRTADRKRMAQLETQFKEQLAERNQVLLTIWKKLSVMCGPDWAHNNSLINGNLPSQEVIGNMLFWPGFSRNLLLAAKQVEGILNAFKDKIKQVERNLWKEYQSLEHTLELRTKKLERIEESWERIKLRQAEADAQLGHGGRSSAKTPELTKLKGENRLLRAELQLLQQQQYHQNSRQRHSRIDSRASVLSGGTEATTAATLDGMINGPNGIPPRASSARRGRTIGLERHHTTNVVEHLASYNGGELPTNRSNSVSSRNSGFIHTEGERGRGLTIYSQSHTNPSNGVQSQASQHPHNRATSTGSSDAASLTSAGMTAGGGGGGGNGNGQEKWIHRLRELERRLKAEREARLLDRSGMRKRLEERDAVNEELRMELERERVRRSTDNPDEAMAQEKRFIRARPEVVDLSGDEMPTPRRR